MSRIASIIFMGVLSSIGLIGCDDTTRLYHVQKTPPAGDRTADPPDGSGEVCSAPGLCLPDTLTGDGGPPEPGRVLDIRQYSPDGAPVRCERVAGEWELWAPFTLTTTPGGGVIVRGLEVVNDLDRLFGDGALPAESDVFIELQSEGSGVIASAVLPAGEPAAFLPLEPFELQSPWDDPYSSYYDLTVIATGKDSRFRIGLRQAGGNRSQNHDVVGMADGEPSLVRGLDVGVVIGACPGE